MYCRALNSLRASWGMFATGSLVAFHGRPVSESCPSHVTVQMPLESIDTMLLTRYKPVFP